MAGNQAGVNLDPKLLERIIDKNTLVFHPNAIKGLSSVN
jgi:hypothetical protein